MHKLFIDGQEGTTGLQIHERVKARSDLTLLEIDPERRKDPLARKALLNEADLVIACLPDAAAKEAASLIDNPNTRMIDASTAHRTADGWTYGFPELEPGRRQSIRDARRVSVPGCHATGFLAAMRPLVLHGLVPADYPAVVHSLTGYSGAGKKMIRTYEVDAAGARALRCPRPYALGLKHKHSPEMHKFSGLQHAPLFMPVIADFYKGMIVTLALFPRLLARRPRPADVHATLAGHYQGETFVRVAPLDAEANLDEGFLSPLGCNDTNRLDLFVFGHDDQIVVAARLDNLGKGASGAAVQNLNLMLGLDETLGLTA